MALSLLLSQWALASYVCPRQIDMQAMMEAGLPCAGMDEEQPALCHQHAADPGKTFEALKLPAPSLPAIVQVIERPLAPAADAAAARARHTAPEPRPPPDPLFLATLRLRV